MRRILDTSVLIRCWRHHEKLIVKRGGQVEDISEAEVVAWADELIDLHGNAEIVTPVRVEFIAGARNRREYQLALAFLDRFTLTDKGTVTRADWEAAEHRAARIPPDGRPRDLGDCIIVAIAQRLNRDVFTLDQRFQR